MAEGQPPEHTRDINKCRKFCALIGAFVTLLPTCFNNVWGNISIYVISYYNEQHGMTSGLTSPWVLSTFYIGFNVGLNFNGLLVNVFKLQTNLIWATIVCNSSYLLCYFALVHGIAPLFFTAVFLIGMSIGIQDGAVFSSLTEWGEKDNGTLISVACSGLNFGPFVINPIMGTYVNPDNLSPDSSLDKMEIFSQREVTDKVPSMFLILGVICFALQIFGHGMLMQKLPKCSVNNSFFKSKTRKDYGTVSFSQEIENEYTENATNREIMCGEIETVEEKFNERMSARNLESNEDVINSLTTSEAHTNAIEHYTPLQLFKQHVFYVMWLSFGSITFSKLLLNNYYKTFGLLTIHDDRFLTAIGSGIGVAGGVAILCWGVALDRFNIKTSLVALYSSLVGLTLMMYFSPNLDKWLYFVISVLFGCINSCVYPTFVTAVLEFFGGKHFSSNLGLLSTANLAMSFAAPPLFVFFLAHFGWFSLFGWTASLILLDLIIIVLTCPHSSKKLI